MVEPRGRDLIEVPDVDLIFYRVPRRIRGGGAQGVVSVYRPYHLSVMLRVAGYQGTRENAIYRANFEIEPIGPERSFSTRSSRMVAVPRPIRLDLSRGVFEEKLRTGDNRHRFCFIQGQS